MAPVAKQKRSGAPKAQGAVRAKSGCYTCRIRRKKCDEKPDGNNHCATCVRLRLECLGFGPKRPDWLRDSSRVVEIRDKIKTFLAKQGMIKGHSGSGARSIEDGGFCMLSDSYSSSTESPSTTAISISSHEGEAANYLTSSIRNTWENPSGLAMTPPFSDSVQLQPSSSPPYHHTPSVHYPTMVDQHPYATFDSPTTSAPTLVPTSNWPPNTFIYGRSKSLAPAFRSSFSETYHMHMFDEEQEEEAFYIPGFQLPHMLDDLLNHYSTHVIPIEYLLADPQVLSALVQFVGGPGAAGKAVRLVASVHRSLLSQQLQCQTSLDQRPPRDRALLLPEINSKYNELQMSVMYKERFSQDDAFAALQVISAMLFDGGFGEWQEWLSVPRRYCESVLFADDRVGPAEAMLNASETERFIIKTTFWFDCLGAVTYGGAPYFLNALRTLYSPVGGGASIEEGGDPISAYRQRLPSQLSMLDVMGCESHIVWALAEVSALAEWKREQEAWNRLSVPNLVERGSMIEAYLLPDQSSTSSAIDLESKHVQRMLTSEIFRASTKVYLHSVLSGSRPGVKEISEGVRETLAIIEQVPETGTFGVSRSVMRSTVFSVFLCGCLTEDVELREQILERMNKQCSERVGNCSSVKGLLKGVWRKWDQQGGEVKWREALNESQILLV